MEDGYHNGKGLCQAQFDALRSNPIFKPYFHAYNSVMNRGGVDLSYIELHFHVQRSEHMRGFDNDELDWVSYRAAVESAMNTVVIALSAQEDAK